VCLVRYQTDSRDNESVVKSYISLYLTNNYQIIQCLYAVFSTFPVIQLQEMPSNSDSNYTGVF
jgi:hypothetical protein